MCSILLALTLLLAACSDHSQPDPAVTAPPEPTCEKEKTIQRADYRALMQTRLEGFARTLPGASNDDLTRYLRASFKMLQLFQGDHRACVVEANGRVSRLVWGEKALETERAQIDRYSAILFPRLPTAKTEIEAESETSLLAFLKTEVATGRANGRVHLRFEKSDHPENEAKALGQFEARFAELETYVVSSLSANVTNYSSPQAKLALATELPALAPVVAYFKRVHGQDLSDVVVVAAPTATIPHTGGGAYQSALGIFIPPIALPIKLDVALPRKIKGTLVVTIDGQDALVKAAMKRRYRSEKLIHLDVDLLATRSTVAFEATAAHELRHLIDYFACPQSRAPFCDQRQVDADWAAVKRQGQEREPQAYADYVADPATQRTRAAMIALHVKHRPGEETEGGKWADAGLKQLFDANYLPTYPFYFSMKEQSGYREQLAYLKSTGMSAAEAVNRTLATSSGESIPITMGAVTEKVPWPGRPWLATLFYSLF